MQSATEQRLMEVILFMGKRIKANLYTETKIIWNGYEHLAVRNDDGTLFSQGHYKTHILPADLPEWYVYGRYYRNFGYLSAKGVRHLHYHPNFITNHFPKDDILFISYSEKIILNEDVLKIAGYDERICGSEIIAFVIAAEKYSEYDVSEIKEAIKNKSQWLKEHFPDDYEREVGCQPLFQESV